MTVRALVVVAAVLSVAGCRGVSGSTGTASISPVSPSPSPVAASTGSSPSPAPLRTCGSVPTSSGATARRIGITVTAPAPATTGSTLAVKVGLRSLDGKAHRLVLGEPQLLLVRNGKVVGQYKGAVAASAIGVTVPAATGTSLDASVLLSGCPTEPIDVSAPDLTREALPPGSYDIIAVVEDVTNGPGGNLVSAPAPLQVVTDPHALPTCGEVPASTEPPQSRIAGVLTGPSTARSGSTVRLQVMLRSNRGRPEKLQSALPFTVLIVRGGIVVGRTDDATAAVALDLTVPASGTIPLLHRGNGPDSFGEVSLSGCPAAHNEPLPEARTSWLRCSRTTFMATLASWSPSH
jgi:hypothetical protein